jgi:hypothetical protein
MTNLKKNNNKQWNNKTERYKISNTDERYSDEVSDKEGQANIDLLIIQSRMFIL